MPCCRSPQNMSASDRCTPSSLYSTVCLELSSGCRITQPPALRENLSCDFFLILSILEQLLVHPPDPSLQQICHAMMQSGSHALLAPCMLISLQDDIPAYCYARPGVAPKSFSMHSGSNMQDLGLIFGSIRKTFSITIPHLIKS